MRTDEPPPVERARRTDAPRLHRLRRDVEDWLAERGIAQWTPGGVSERTIAAQIDRGLWHVLREPGSGVVAALRLLWSDPEFWGADSTPAAYVHSLMVDRRAAGRGLGEALLRWAADQGRTAGVGLLRLDCVESNTALRSYYRRLGFTEVGRREFERFHSVTLLQQRIG